MIINLPLFLAGIFLAWLTLRDVFETVVVPGGSSRTSLQVTRRVGTVLLALWKRVRGRRRGISGPFAPLVLVSSFIIWMSLLALAFGAMVFAARTHFHPAVRTFGDSVYVAGSALATVGLSPHFPLGAGRWIILGAGFCGLAVMTMAVTYLLEVQASISRRDTGIIKLNTSAGHPPSALTLLERFAALRNQSDLREDLKEGRNWCATVRQSHSSHPSLVYFQSANTGAGWPAALGTLLDLALLAEHCLDEESLYGPAILLREEGTRMAEEIAASARLDPSPRSADEPDLALAARRLADCGYRLRDNPDFSKMAEVRAGYQGKVDAIAEHLGKPPALLIRPR